MGKIAIKTFRFVGMISFLFILLLFLVSVAIGTAPQDHIAGKAKWTIMIYSDASDNILDNDSLSEMAAMERVGSNKDVKIIIQWYRDIDMSSETYRCEKWNGAKRFLVCKGNNSSQELENLCKVDMTNMNSLTEFINWTVAKYPAERYALVMYDHGGGWEGHTYDKFDNHATLKSLAKALEKAGFRNEKKLDLIIFDQCFMGQIDVAYAMAPYAKAMVASEDVERNIYLDEPLPEIAENSHMYEKQPIWPLSALAKNPYMDEKELATAIVNGYKFCYEKMYPHPFTTLSALDLEKISNVINATRNLSAALKEHAKQRWPDIGRCVGDSEHFMNSEGLVEKQRHDIIDLLDFANLEGQAITDRDVETAVNELKVSFGSALIAEYNGEAHSFAHGLSAYFPMNEGVYDHNYTKESNFSTKTGWNDLLKGYIEAAASVANKSAPSIEINSVFPQPSNITNSAMVSCSVTGRNISYITKILGLKKGDKIIGLDESSIESYSLNSTSKLYKPFKDGENDFNFSFSPITHVLRNKENSLLVRAVPADQYGEGTCYLQVDGVYSIRNDSFKPFNARLMFDGRTGKLISAIDLDEMDAEFEPKSGGTFAPTNDAYERGIGKWEYDNTSNISLSDFGIWLDQCYPQDGSYYIGLYAEDLSGNNDTKWASMEISGQLENKILLNNSYLMGNWVITSSSTANSISNLEFLGYKLSDNDKEDLKYYGLEFPSCKECDDWYWCNMTSNRIGVANKSAQGIYWIRYENGWPLLTTLLFEEDNPKPIYNIYLIDTRDIPENKLTMYDLNEASIYTLSRQINSE